MVTRQKILPGDSKNYTVDGQSQLCPMFQTNLKGGKVGKVGKVGKLGKLGREGR